ncbi:MAG: response regulator [candidate division NC10 bacterium]|nr:response regulator [candidate division NC10 bacterium]
MGKRRGTIMVVDDRPEVRLFFEEALSLEGFTVAAVGSGYEALAALEKGRPDVIFLDLKMPGMDGIETLRRIKEKDARARVVIVTAYPDVETAREAMALGASDYLGKPCSLALLLQVADEHLGQLAVPPSRRA